MSIMYTKILVAGIAVSLVGCGGGRGGGWQGSVTDSAGIAIVRNPSQGIWGSGDAWTVVEELRIGTAEGDPDYQFGLLAQGGSIAVASDGGIVALDQLGQHLKVFTPDGKYERTIGGPGGGPGELGRGAGAVLLAPGDTILVSDISNQRANLYLLDGTFIRSFPLNIVDGIPVRWESSANGRIVAQLRRLAFPGSTAPPDSMDVIVVRNLDGSTGDTLMHVPSGKTVSFSGGAPRFDLFSAEPAWALLGDRILYGVNDEYRIGIYAPGSKLERVVEKPFERDAVGEADQQAVKDLLGKAWTGAGATPQQVAQLMTGVHFAANYPAYAQMLGGSNGTIWVQHIQAPSKLSEEERATFNPQFDLAAREWDVFDNQGRFLGVVAMPRRFQPVLFIGDKIYGIQRDELDVQYVVRLGIVKGKAAAS
jgi:hypothetical protein